MESVDTKAISRPKGTYTQFDDGIQWVSNKQIPPIGEEVTVKVNGIGRSKVIGHYTQHGFIGMLVEPQNPPTWYIKQNGSDPCHVFPAECLELQVRNDDGKVDEKFYQDALREN